ncbi:bacteriocin [candidate division GN15 bacterium]|nr:bacteriocin [candidate division GN15 bacterium]
MDILKRELAPISDSTWEEINETAQRVLSANLSARKIVDFDGPKGWEYSAVPLGRLEMMEQHEAELPEFGIRKIQPLVETRVLFELDMWELDNADRGAEDIDLDPLERACRKLAAFEEKAIYDGLESAGIKGIIPSAEHKTQTFSGEAYNLLQAVSSGITELSRAGVEGPYQLVCGPELWRGVASQEHGYPLNRHLEHMLGNEIILNPFVEDTLLVSTRGGDMKLTVGADFSIGYNAADAKKVSLYLTESFTFRVLDGGAIVPIEWKK